MEDDKEYQKKHLTDIYSFASMAPVFKRHLKYCTGIYEGCIPYISFDDVMNYRYIIRGRPTGINNRFDFEEREIIMEYETMDELINDGWRLD